MLINTYLDTEDFVYLNYPDDEPPAAQGCGAGARMASKYPPRPPSPTEYTQRGCGSGGSGDAGAGAGKRAAAGARCDMSERERPEPAPHRVRAADLYPRLRTAYDEPGLDVPFTPICAEFVQWVGRTADGGIVAMSNYRLHAQPRRRNGPGASVPLRLIDAVEIRDLLHLIVLCKNGRQLRCTFNTGEQCLEWWRRLSGGLAPLASVQETFAAAYAAWAKEQPPASVHRALLRASQAHHRHWFGPEVERLGLTARGAWRVSAANADYALCPSYPPLLVVPATIGDEDLDSVARFRAMRRVPAVVWRHRGNGAVIARSSQPEVGWLGWRSSEDERLLAAFITACNADRGLQPPNTNKQVKLLIVDARSYASAVTNRARGGGCECQQYYPGADIQFMSLPNIHHVRRSFQQMRALAAEPSDQNNWHSGVERTLWLQYLSGVVRAASGVARAVLAGRPVLVHCSDGWDRTPQIVAAAQLLLDPHYRTLEGFRILIEREWLDFGHKFADRCGHQLGPEDPNERSPIFLQWLDVVHQLMLQYPCSFEFSDAYLIKLATHVHSCMFGTFLCNTGRERHEARLADTTAHVWQLLRAPAYRNHLYSPHADLVLWPEYSVRAMQVWWSLFGGEREEPDDDAEPDAPRTQPPAAGLMTKTRSCDNLLNEAEKRTTQRRCSDPSLAPDVMKLSSMMGGECRAALTDSCVDELPSLAQRPPQLVRDQVDGLHPDHFENSSQMSRDITSGSSSLERELGGAAEILDKVIDHTIENRLPEHTLNDSDDNISCTDYLRCGSMAAAQDSDRRSSDHTVVGTSESTVRFIGASDVGTPEEPAVFVCEPYSDVIGVSEVSRDAGRTRNVSITWRSISESSNQSSTGYEVGEPPVRADAAPGLSDATSSTPDIASGTPDLVKTSSHESSPIDNHNSTEGDLVNHNVVSELTNHNRLNGVTNGSVNGELTSKFLEAELNGGVTSSSISSESECEVGAGACAGGARRGPRASQLTLCPASPRRLACCHCNRPSTSTSGIETSGECSGGGNGEVWWCGVCGGEAGGERVRCACGASGALPAAPDPVDGLPPAADPLQARLHQIILYQKKVVEELSGQLREAREALRRATPPPARPRASPSAPQPSQMGEGSGSAGGSGSLSSRAGSSSGSASEVEVGEEARGVVWLPDSAAPRCQHCRNHFWLARRRHHCRRCGGIFCGSCSEMSAWGECGAVRLCRRCRALR